MSSLVISGDTSGAITLAAPAVSGTNTATLPAATGTVMVSGNMPAFSAYGSTVQTISTASYTKIILNNIEFDTSSAFDYTTNYRFNPKVAGYYQINGSVWWNTASGTTYCETILYKNGSIYKFSPGYITPNGYGGAGVSSVVYFNGSTDYVELYTIQSSGSSQTTSPNLYGVFMNGSLIRGA